MEHEAEMDVEYRTSKQRMQPIVLITQKRRKEKRKLEIVSIIAATSNGVKRVLLSVKVEEAALPLSCVQLHVRSGINKVVLVVFEFVFKVQERGFSHDRSAIE